MGLEAAGFKSVFVNELHPMAMETYLSNRADADLHKRENHCNDIFELTGESGRLDALSRRLRRDFGDVALVVGGPPCQGFSGIGHRRSFSITKEEIPSNHLYREMADVVAAIGPRAFVFENVRGLLSSRWTPDGDKGEIWVDVQRAFRDIEVRRGRKRLGYEVRAAVLSAGDYGVPQNRPRVLLVGIRTDIALPTKGPVADGFLPAPVGQAPDLMDLLDDLADPDWIPGGAMLAYLRDPQTEWQELLRRDPSGGLLGVGAPLTDHEYSKHRPDIVAKFEYMLRHDGQIPAEMRTKKFAQRVMPARWGERGPTITATSLPDDYVHYRLPRTPTVREWARLQTFPDWYRFSGPRTTGGRRRAGDPSAGVWTRDLPKYTQIGNAVPVSLARAVGGHLLEVVGA
jgi:DNA (cytosine-5)-methyltransferase 1